MDKNKEEFIQERVSKLEKVCMPIVEFIKNNYDPHTTVVITDSQIKLVRDEIGIPVKEAAPEVPVQKQFIGKCEHCGKLNLLELPQCTNPKFCMYCGNDIHWTKKECLPHK